MSFESFAKEYARRCVMVAVERIGTNAGFSEEDRQRYVNGLEVTTKVLRGEMPLNSAAMEDMSLLPLNVVAEKLIIDSLPLDFENYIYALKALIEIQGPLSASIIYGEAVKASHVEPMDIRIRFMQDHSEENQAYFIKKFISTYDLDYIWKHIDE